jgi:hypothetical protein
MLRHLTNFKTNSMKEVFMRLCHVAQVHAGYLASHTWPTDAQRYVQGQITSVLLQRAAGQENSTRARHK